MAACPKNNRAAAAAAPAAPPSRQETFQARFWEKKSGAQDEVIAQSAEKRDD